MKRPIAVSTASGRCLYVAAEPYHVTLADTAKVHGGHTLLTAQARELGEALIAAADAVEGKQAAQGG